MDENEKAKNKDKILKFILAEPNGMNNTHISRSLFKNAIGASEVKKLVYEIADYDKFIIDIEERKDGIVVKPNDLTHKFVSTNSFVKLNFQNVAGEFMEETEKDKKLRFEEEFRELQKENLQLSNRLNRQKINTHWAPITISIFGLMIAVASYLKPAPENDRIEQLETRLEQMQHKLNARNDSLWNEIQTLKDSVK